jgi:hypothetical protein
MQQVRKVVFFLRIGSLSEKFTLSLSYYYWSFIMVLSAFKNYNRWVEFVFFKWLEEDPSNEKIHL